MKKSIILFVCLCFVVLNALGQMQGSNLPRFVRWLDNDQLVIQTKLNNDKIAKEYVYHISSKQYTLAPATAVNNDKSTYVKNANIYLKENGIETQLTFDAIEEIAEKKFNWCIRDEEVQIARKNASEKLGMKFVDLSKVTFH
jgi:NurA-like 5'-3' nuclease